MPPRFVFSPPLSPFFSILLSAHFHSGTTNHTNRRTVSTKRYIYIYLYSFISFVSHTFVSFTEKLMVHHERIVSKEKKILAILFYPFPFFLSLLFFECTRSIVPIKLDSRNLERALVWSRPGCRSRRRARNARSARRRSLLSTLARTRASVHFLSRSFPRPFLAALPVGLGVFQHRWCFHACLPVCVPGACTRALAQSAATADKDASHRL